MAFNPTNLQETSDAVEECVDAAPSSIDSLIESHIKGGDNALRMYDGVTHRRMFNLPKAVRKQLASDKRVMTKENPIFMY